MLAFSSVWYGCAGQSDAQLRPQPRDVPEPAATVIDARPAALIDGRSVSWGELRTMLSELAGAEVLREVAIDLAIERELAQSSVIITPELLEAERVLLLETLSDDPNVAARLLDELRARQGLGPVRFNALMYRNAALRAMVKNRVTVNDAGVRAMFDAVHGPKRQARLMILSTLPGVQTAMERLEAGEFFGDVAVELSNDASATRGGLLEPISRSDGSYPESLRAALWTLKVGDVSRPILLNDQYAVLMLVRTIDGDEIELADVYRTMERRVRRQQERLLMDQLARDLVQNVSLTIFDDSLNESWRMARRVRR